MESNLKQFQERLGQIALAKGRPLRVFYLLNHQTAMPFEVEIFRQMGFEVFVPKILSDDNVDYRSAVVSYQWDSTLSIQKSYLDRLNAHNFYDEVIPGDVSEIVNSYFDIVFSVALKQPLDSFLGFFDGVFALRIYGQDNTFLYSSYFERELGASLPVRAAQLGEKFIFASIFPHTADGEAEWLSKNALCLPVGVPDSYYKSNCNSWVGGGKHLVFHCPDIESKLYYKWVYDAFCNDFGDLDYRIIGVQSKQVADPNVLGYVSKQEFDDVMSHASLFLYSSPEYKHLHYTPLEAMISGMPVVFNRNGALFHMFSGDAPGSYETVEEARELISRISSGDQSLIAAIVESQKPIVARHTFEWCLEQWLTQFDRKILPLLLDRTTPALPCAKIKMKLAVILPAGYRGGTLRGALNIVRMLVIGAKLFGDDLEVCFGHLDDPLIYSDEDFEIIRELGVSVRSFTIGYLPGDKLAPLYRAWLDVDSERLSDSYVVFNDGISNFEDSDFWLLISDRIPGGLPPGRNYALVTYDYIQRYVPEIFGSSDTNLEQWKNFECYAKATRLAQFVICTTAQTTRDCISYAGASPDRVVHFPMEFDPIEISPDKNGVEDKELAPYILWTTNSTEHKNHLRILDGLERYFTKFPDSPLEVRVTGYFTHLFVDNPEAERTSPLYQLEYPRKVRERIKKSACLKKRINSLGLIDDAQYIQELAGAQWLLHGALYDNGTYSLVEAAWFGVPSISSDYPAIREICEYFGLSVVLFDAMRPADLCRVLELALAERDGWVKKLPTRERLGSRSYTHLAPRFWYLFKQTYLRTSFCK